MRFFAGRSSRESRLPASVSGQDFWTFQEKSLGPKVAKRIMSDPRGAKTRLLLIQMPKSGLARVSLKRRIRFPESSIRHSEPFATLRANYAMDLAPVIAHHSRYAGRVGKLFLAAS
jgi:hypothetical protein